MIAQRHGQSRGRTARMNTIHTRYFVLTNKYIGIPTPFLPATPSPPLPPPHLIPPLPAAPNMPSANGKLESPVLRINITGTTPHIDSTTPLPPPSPTSHPLIASQGFPSTRRGCAEAVVMAPWCPAITLALNTPALAGACHPKDMKPLRGGVVLLALSPPFWDRHR